MKRSLFLVLLICSCAVATSRAQTYAVGVVRDVPYLDLTRYADGRDARDLYVPDGRRNAPVIVWYYGNLLMGSFAW